MVTALVGGKLIDGKGGAALLDAALVIDGSKIVQVSQQREFGDDVQVYDVSGKTVMPGLIDCHQHFATWPSILASKQMKGLMYHASTTVAFMKQYLQGGCTSARDCGGLEAGWVQAIDDGLIEGPRIKTCVTQIQATNGMMDWMPGIGGAITPQGMTVPVPGIPVTWADGPDAVRAKVREVLRYGADFVKAFNTAVPWTGVPRLRGDRPLWTRAEVEALVDEAHRAGVPVTIHCLGEQAMWEAVQAGADSIDHGYPLTEQIAREMAERGTWWIPTLQIIGFHAKMNPDPTANRIAGQIWEEQVPQAFENARRYGVPIAVGTDFAVGPDLLGKELQLMTQFGMSPAETIVAGTSNAAKAMYLDDLVGSLEAGKEADLLVVDGDPLEDIGVLTKVENLSLVMKAGKPCSGPMAREFPLELPTYPRFLL
jgi:imidazolonepropionase-like amidohydrolase